MRTYITTARSMIRAAIACTAAIGLVVVGCRDEPVGPTEGKGSIVLVVRTSPAASAAPSASGAGSADAACSVVDLTRVQATARGASVRQIDLTRGSSGFSGTISALSPGSYTVDLQGFLGTDVDCFGETTGFVQVVAGQTTPATIDLLSFRPVLLPLNSASLTISATFTSVSAADDYIVQWDTLPDFATRSELTFPDTEVTFAVSRPALYNVRVMASNDMVARGRPSDAESVDVSLAPSQISSVSATSQVEQAGSDAGDPPSVLVQDANGNPVPGVSVTFTVTAGTGAVTLPASGNGVLTGADGTASLTSWTVGTVAGEANTVEASAAGFSGGGNPVTFNATVTPASADAASSTATVPGTGMVGVQTDITIQARDRFGNALTTGGASVDVSITGANSPQIIIIADFGDGRYLTDYTPMVAGTDNIAITLNGTVISGSPFTSVVSPAGVDPASSTATVPPTGTAGSPTGIVVQARDAFGNAVTMGGAAVVVTVMGANTATPLVTDNLDGTYSAGYAPTVAGKDDIAIELNNTAISGSPFTSEVSAAGLDPASSTATVPPTGTVGSPTSMLVQARDVFGNPVTAGGATVVVRVIGANAAMPAVTDNQDGTYSAGYTPVAAGTDSIAITLNGTVINGSPFTSVVSAGGVPARIFSVSATSQGAPAGSDVGDPPSVLVEDANGNPVPGVSVTFTVTAGTGAVTLPASGSGVLTGAGGMASLISWTVGTVAGEPNTVEASAAGFSGGGNPVTFNATVTPASADAASSTATVPATGMVGVQTDITIQARDRFGNALTTGGASVDVSITGANSPQIIIIADFGNGTYLTDYTPTNPGADNIDITLGGVPIGGSPFTSVVKTIYGSAFTVGGASTLFSIDPLSGFTSAIGPIGFNRVGAMDFDPITGRLYATGQRPADNTPVLIAIDVTTGTGLEVGPLGLPIASISDLSFRSDGTLFAYDAEDSANHVLYVLDLGSGLATFVGSTGLSFNGGNGISFDSDDILFHSNRDFAHILSPVASQVAAMSFPLGCQSLENLGRIAAADLGPNGVFFAAVKCVSGGGAELLGIVDYSTGTVTPIGATVTGLDALAIGNP